MKILPLACVCILLYAVGAYSALITSPIPCPVNINPNYTGACNIQNIEWFSQTSAIINTGDNKLWRTTDEGRTFTQIGKNMNYIAQHPANPLVMVFLSASGTNFSYTLDGGATLLTSNTKVGRLQVMDIQFHPTKIGYLLFVGRYNGPENKRTLYTTTDWGANWSVLFTGTLSKNVPVPAVWGNSTADENSIFVLKQDGTFGYTNDFNKFHEISKNTKAFYKTRHYIFTVVTENNQQELRSSSAIHDPAHTKKDSYIKASFPGNSQHNADSFTFLDDTTTAEYMALHMSDYYSWGDVYSSNAAGYAFELTLASVYRKDDIYDFHRVRGLNGVYIANVITNTDSKEPPRRTVITFDNGGEWRDLVPPPTDMLGNPWPCAGQPGCALHLHGESSLGEILGVPALRSHSNAIGVIIANGNVGFSLSVDFFDLKTFISRDAGLTWTQIFSQASDVEFGDHGGIIVLTPIVQTNHSYYSFDQGLSRIQVSTTDFPNLVQVTNIVTEPQGTGLNFLIQGKAADQRVYLYSYDLSDLQLPICGDSDYETWSPSDGVSAVGCLMGQTTTYLRRKPASQCYNNRTTDVVLTQVPCNCTYEDYECAPNYQSSQRGADGAFTCAKVSEDPKCTPGEKYNEPTGYQLVPGNKCTNGKNLLGKEKKCSSSHGGVIAAVIVVVLVIAVVTAVVLYFKNERFRDAVTSCKDSVKGGGRKESYRGLTEANDDDDDDNTV